MPLKRKSLKVEAFQRFAPSRRLTTSVGRWAAVNRPYAAVDVHCGRLLAASRLLQGTVVYDVITARIAAAWRSSSPPQTGQRSLMSWYLASRPASTTHSALRQPGQVAPTPRHVGQSRSWPPVPWQFGQRTRSKALLRRASWGDNDVGELCTIALGGGLIAFLSTSPIGFSLAGHDGIVASVLVSGRHRGTQVPVLVECR